jgi:hypothetical protein
MLDIIAANLAHDRVARQFTRPRRRAAVRTVRAVTR